MDISILVSPPSDPAQARACVESLLRTLPPKLDWELLLSASPEPLGLRHDRLRVLPAPAVPGLAAARNAAVAVARSPTLCFLSPGATLMPGWLQPMLRLLRRAPSAGCVGNVQREPYSGLIDHAGVRFDADGLPVAFWANQPLLPRERHDRHPAVSLACALVSRETCDRVGGFDARFQGPLGDVDFCLRAATFGYRHYVANRGAIYCYQHSLPDPSPVADLAFYRSLWGDRARAAHARRAALLAAPASALPSAEAWELTREQRRLWRQRVGDARRDGHAYLRKHLHRPWRYNYGRICAALAKALQPAPGALPPTPGLSSMPVPDTARPDDGWLFDPPPQP